jgi:3-methyladenine DNA glycosylase AlkD
MLSELEQALKKAENPEKAKLLQRFFKTGKGEYGEGDIFLGIIVPKQREIAKQFSNLHLDELQTLLNSKIHEKRLIALLILLIQYKKANKEKNENKKQEIFNFYLKNTKNINNWDLVDLSCRDIIGNFLLDKDRKLLYQLAKSSILWERRISIISTFAFIAKSQLEDTIKLAELLLQDKHDLMHKAVGWALREAGKKDKNVLLTFLNKHSKVMPRTMLRYAIEKLTEKEREFYMRR